MQAPVHAVAWTPARGFITELDELLEAQGEGEVILTVTDVTTASPAWSATSKATRRWR